MRHSPALQKELYRTMLRIRLTEESFVQPILNGTIRTPVHLYTGQEAIATGICAALTHEDYIFGSHRSHGHYLAKGGDLRALVAEIYGKNTGCARGHGGSMHMISQKVGMLGAVPIVAGTIPLALGAALAARIKKTKRVVVSFFGDGALGEGGLHESLNFAALKKLPLIFVCENNAYSTHLPLRECRPKNNIWEVAKPYGIHTQRLDGNNVSIVYEAARKAIARCRAGRGPVFLECLTYRLRGHVGPDDNLQGEHTEIRPKAEVERWKKKDPLIRLERLLLRNGSTTPKELAHIQRQVEQEVRAAHTVARRSLSPDPNSLHHYVYKT